MQKSFVYRLYPTRKQEAEMAQMLETHRHIYNDALAQRIDVWEAARNTVSYNDQSADFKINRRYNGFLARTNFSSAQRTLRRLDRAYQAFFRRVKAGEKAGFPRFKGRGRFDSIEFTHRDGCRMLDSGRARFQYVGDVKVKLHRPYEGKVKTMRLKRKAGKWYLVLSCDLGDVVPVKRPIEREVGIDLGLKTFGTFSDGGSMERKRFFRDGQAKLRRLQRRVSRRKKGSKRWRKACAAVATHHFRIDNQRRDFHFQEVAKLVTAYDLIVVEDLNIKGLARTRMAKSVVDAAWGQFINILEFKAECAGATVIKVNPAFTTQACSSCGSIEGPKGQSGLAVREWACSCGVTHDRDVNAAKNILRLGSSLHERIGRIAA